MPTTTESLEVIKTVMARLHENSSDDDLPDLAKLIAGYGRGPSAVAATDTLRQPYKTGPAPDGANAHRGAPMTGQSGSEESDQQIAAIPSDSDVRRRRQRALKATALNTVLLSQVSQPPGNLHQKKEKLIPDKHGKERMLGGCPSWSDNSDGQTRLKHALDARVTPGTISHTADGGRARGAPHRSSRWDENITGGPALTAPREIAARCVSQTMNISDSTLASNVPIAGDPAAETCEWTSLRSEDNTESRPTILTLYACLVPQLHGDADVARQFTSETAAPVPSQGRGSSTLHHATC